MFLLLTGFSLVEFDILGIGGSMFFIALRLGFGSFSLLVTSNVVFWHFFVGAIFSYSLHIFMVSVTRVLVWGG